MSHSQQFDLRQLFVMVTCVAIGVSLIHTNHEHLWKDSEGLSLSSEWVVVVAIVYAFAWSVVAILTTYLVIDVAKRSSKTGLLVFLFFSVAGFLYNSIVGIWAMIS